MFDDQKINMMNPRGRVIQVPYSQKASLLKQGFRIIVNAREQYYPNYDTKNKTWETDDLNIRENIEPSNYLEVKKL